MSPALAPDTLPALAEAYNEVFTTPYGRMVLCDLAQQSGFMAALPLEADAAVLRDHNARRALFGRVYEILRLSNAGREALVQAIMPDETKENQT